MPAIAYACLSGGTDSPGDVGGGGDVHAFPVISTGGGGAQFTFRTDHSSLRWLQKFRNEDGMLAHWYLLLGQFSVTFEYCPGPSMQMWMVCPANVASVRGRIARFRRQISP